MNMRNLLSVNKNEINPVDILNTIFIAIVLYLHHGTYTTNYLSIIKEIKINNLLQVFAIGGFLFFSGLKLSISHLDTPSLSFLKNRFIRIYILYLISLSMFSLIVYPHLYGVYPIVKNFIMHALCLQYVFIDLFQGRYHTIWYISMLAICYLYFLATRHLLKESNSIKYFFIFFLTCVAVAIAHVLGAKVKLHLFSYNFLMYLSFFVFGMFFSKKNNINFSYIKFISLGLIFSIISIIIPNIVDIERNALHGIYNLSSFISCVSIYIILLNILKRINIPVAKYNFIKKISYSSFCIFLFHRPIWTIMFFLFPQKSFIQWVYIMVIGLPLIFLISYNIQYHFDKVLRQSALYRRV